MQYFRIIRGAWRPLLLVVVLALGAVWGLYVMRPAHPVVLNPAKASGDLTERNRIEARRSEVRKTVDRWVRYQNEVQTLVGTLEGSIQMVSTAGSSKGSWELPYLQLRADTYQRYSKGLSEWIERAGTASRLKTCDEALERGDLSAANVAVSQAIELAAVENLVSEKLRHEQLALPLIEELVQRFSSLPLETRMDKALALRSEASLQMERLCQQFSKDEPKVTAELVSRLKNELGNVEDPHHVSEPGDWERKFMPLQWLTAGRDPDVARWAPYFPATASFGSESASVSPEGPDRAPEFLLALLGI